MNDNLKTLNDVELVSIGYAKVPNSKNWVNYVIHSKGNKIIKIEYGTPDQKRIAEDDSKISFDNHFTLKDVL